MPKPRRKKLKTYLVPIVVTGQFGLEAEIKATSMKKAKAKARAGDFDNPDGYDWDRWTETKYQVGSWQRVTLAEDQS